MPNGEFVEAISNLTKCDVERYGNHDTEFLITNSGATPLKYPEPEWFRCLSITQIVNFIKTYIEDGDLKAKEDTGDEEEVQKRPSQFVLNIIEFDRVEFCDGVSLNDNMKIDVAAVSDFSKKFTAFPFGQKLSQEQFIIDVMTKFKQDTARDDLLRTVSSVKAERISESHDDGISQVAATKAGVHLSQKTAIQNLWLLQTFKTFPEVEQPVIPYILRLHQKEEEAPQFALYECDGGQWKVNLAIKVREWLVQALKVELVDKFDRVVIL